VDLVVVASALGLDQHLAAVPVDGFSVWFLQQGKRWIGARVKDSLANEAFRRRVDGFADVALRAAIQHQLPDLPQEDVAGTALGLSQVLWSDGDLSLDANGSVVLDRLWQAVVERFLVLDRTEASVSGVSQAEAMEIDTTRLATDFLDQFMRQLDAAVLGSSDERLLRLWSFLSVGRDEIRHLQTQRQLGQLQLTVEEAHDALLAEVRRYFGEFDASGSAPTPLPEPDDTQSPAEAVQIDLRPDLTVRDTAAFTLAIDDVLEAGPSPRLAVTVENYSVAKGELQRLDNKGKLTDEEQRQRSALRRSLRNTFPFDPERRAAEIIRVACTYFADYYGHDSAAVARCAARSLEITRSRVAGLWPTAGTRFDVLVDDSTHFSIVMTADQVEMLEAAERMPLRHLTVEWGLKVVHLMDDVVSGEVVPTAIALAAAGVIPVERFAPNPFGEILRWRIGVA
jgi:hypothetical protein